MKMNSTMSMVGLAVLVLGALIAGAVWNNTKPSIYDDFAMCLTDAGAVEYAAHWCAACAQQEELFGTAKKHVNRVECSSPGSSTFDLCPDITSTPTWEFADGSREIGVQSLASLAERTGCELPQ